MIHRFGRWELDEGLFELRRDGGRVPLEKKSFDVLRHLVHHRERVVGKDELFEAVWPAEYVTESVLHRCVSLLRKTLGDDRDRLATVRGRGYRFVGTLESGPAAAPAAAAPEAEPDPRAPAARARALQEAFLGRESVLAELHACRAEAAAGRGRAVALVGEPGIGKTRVVQELLRDLPAGVCAAVGRAPEGDGAPPFWPWIELLRALVAEPAERSAADEELAAVLARLEGAASSERRAHDDRAASGDPASADARPSPGRPAAPPGEDLASDRLSQRERFQLFDAAGRALAARARAEPVPPLVLVLEDVHAADAPSLALMEQLAQGLASLPLLVVATFRDERRPRDHPFARLRGELARLGHVQRIHLAGLSREDAARLLEVGLGRPPPAPLVDAVHARTEGSPLFLRETVRWILAQPQADFAELVPEWELVLPDGVRDVIERRLAALGEETVRVLEIASLVGREFEAALVADVHGDAARVHEALERARAARVVEPIAPGAAGARFTFSHALVREVLVEGLPHGMRVHLHVRVGEALEKRHTADPEPVLGALAHHFFEAFPLGGEERALAYAERAARAARARLAPEETALHTERAVALLERSAAPDPQRRLALLFELGEAWRAVGDVERLRSAYQRAAALADALGDAQVYARAVLGALGDPGWGPVPREIADPMLRRALGGLAPEPSMLRVRLLAREAGHASHWDDTEHTLDASARALADARALGEPEALLTGLMARSESLLVRLCEPGGLDEWTGMVEEAARLVRLDASATPDPRFGDAPIALHEWRAMRALLTGDGPGLRRELDAARRLCDASAHPMERWRALHGRVAVALLEGRLAEAESLLYEGFRLGQRYRFPWAGPAYLGGSLELVRQRGLFAAVAPSIREFRRNFLAGFVLLRSIELVIPAEAGHVETVRPELEAWLADDLADVRRDHEWPSVLGNLARTAVRLGHRPAAERLHALLAPYAAWHRGIGGIFVYEGPLALHLGELERLLGRGARAEAHLEAALRAAEAMGSVFHAAEARLELASLLAARRGAAARERARALAGEVRDAIAGRGMKGLEARVQTLEGET